MAKLRALFVLVSVSISATALEASAPVFPLQASAGGASGPLLAADASGRCPRLCVEWFDGCNTCRCANGYINVCTENSCVRRRAARCVRHGF